jgi:hypothetical protein
LVCETDYINKFVVYNKLTTTLGENVVTAFFIPKKEGQYTLLVSHPAKDLAGTTQYHFLSSTVVNVGKISARLDAEAISNELKIFPETTSECKANASEAEGYA